MSMLSLSEKEKIIEGLDTLVEVCHRASVDGGWWHDLETGEFKDRNRGEMLMLIVSEVAETMEGERKNLSDTKLPLRPMPEVELADALIRIGDYVGGFEYDLAGAVIEKIDYNAKRPDHQIENRKQEHGKKF